MKDRLRNQFTSQSIIVVVITIAALLPVFKLYSQYSPPESLPSPPPQTGIQPEFQFARNMAITSQLPGKAGGFEIVRVPGYESVNDKAWFIIL